MINRTCDVCGKAIPADENADYTMSMRLGAQVLEIKYGIGKPFQGDQCVSCTKELLKIAADKGIFVGRKISLPEEVKPKVEALVEKHSWLLR